MPVSITRQALSLVEKGGAGPSSLHATLEGPMEYITECKMDVESTWIPTWHRMDHASWSLGPFLRVTSLR